MARRLRHANDMAVAGLNAFERLGTAVIVLGHAGRIVHANETGRAMMAEADGLRSDAAGLAGSTLAATAVPMLSGPSVLLSVADPSAAAAPWHDGLLAPFQLSPAETGLAVDLMAGHSVSAIAGRRNRSVHTVRSQLASLLTKTGTRRQAELVTLLSRLQRTGVA